MKNKLQTKLQLLNPHLPDEKSIDILTYIRDINFTKWPQASSCTARNKDGFTVKIKIS